MKRLSQHFMPASFGVRTAAASVLGHGPADAESFEMAAVQAHDAASLAEWHSLGEPDDMLDEAICRSEYAIKEGLAALAVPCRDLGAGLLQPDLTARRSSIQRFFDGLLSLSPGMIKKDSRSSRDSES